ncbi:DUF4254 domain-containing protein [Nocardia sp. NPDC059239]|uniref:DUF4254 domain-containing protein n=1 Tax=unclassified Nocardia TaxID=2637762 RepID=UPI0036AFF504
MWCADSEAGSTSRAVEDRRLEPLLDPGQLLCAIRGEQVVDHPLTEWVTDLVAVHKRLATADAGEISEIDRRRADVVYSIDLWIERCVPQHRRGTAMHTETLGTVIDRIVAGHIHAVQVLMTLDIKRDPRVHAAWHRLAELVGGYSDLAFEVVLGRRRLPAPSTA